MGGKRLEKEFSHPLKGSFRHPGAVTGNAKCKMVGKLRLDASREDDPHAFEKPKGWARRSNASSAGTVSPRSAWAMPSSSFAICSGVRRPKPAPSSDLSASSSTSSRRSAGASVSNNSRMRCRVSVIASRIAPRGRVAKRRSCWCCWSTAIPPPCTCTKNGKLGRSAPTQELGSFARGPDGRGADTLFRSALSP